MNTAEAHVQPAGAAVAEHHLLPSGALPLGRLPAALQPALCELREATVCYGQRVANHAVSLAVRPGEVVALLGENGAGKSTALHALYGLVPLSSGQVCYGGQALLASPEQAIAGGVGLVSQHFLLVPRLSVAENIVLGREPRRAGIFFDRARAEAEVLALAESYGLAVQPGRLLSSLSVGEAQRVEILKALYRGARGLLLDEPTAVLTPKEAITLLRALRERFVGKQAERGLLIVTHKLDEVLQVADRVVVLRGGRVVAQVARADFSAREIAHALVGRTLLPISRAEASPAVRGTAATPALAVLGVSAEEGGVERLQDISFELQRGTIVGIAGVEGNGQRELGMALAGLLPLTSGQIRLGGRDITTCSVAQRRQAGMAWVLEDRQRHGLVLDFSLAENLLLGEQDRYRQPRLWGLPLPALARRLIDVRALWATARRLLSAHDVRPADASLPARSLSGGNQQKLLLARALGEAEPGRSAPPVLLAAQPTRGVDIGAVQAIHQTLLAARDSGCAILLISSELDELRTLCDRILVLYRGRIVATLDNPAAAPVERERLGEFLAGLSAPAAAAERERHTA